MDDLILSDLLEQYDSAAEGNKFSLSWIRALLKELRKSKIVRADIVMKWGPKCISGESNIDVWNLHEQICIAAIDTGNDVLAIETIALLKKQFPDSNRVARLSGMLFESQGRYQSALEVYDEILKKDIANLAARKRKVCIFKAQGEVVKQVEELNEVLKFFPADSGCWMELSEIYLSQCDYAAAVHCLEELVLLDPRNAHYHCRLAEAFYSMDGPTNLLAARKHYTISLNFQNATKLNLRALYGLIATCKALQRDKLSKSTTSAGHRKHDPAQEHEDKVSEELLMWAQEQLAEAMSAAPENASTKVMQSILR